MMTCSFHRFHGSALALVLATAALAGCGKDKAADPKAQAAGEVLPGSISDAMLPLDTVRSQPPLAPRAEGSGKAISGGEAGEPGDADPQASDAPEAAPADAPAETAPSASAQ